QLKKIWDAIDHVFKSCQENFKNAEPEEFQL
ncbi:unnamed protein product, partial [marine sediment metagenome]